MRTSEGTETRDSYIEKRSMPMSRSQPSNASIAAASNSSAPARSYWTTQAGAPGSGAGVGGAAESEVRRSSSTAPKQSTLPPIVMQAVIGVNFIADHLKQQDEFNKVLLHFVMLYWPLLLDNRCNCNWLFF